MRATNETWDVIFEKIEGLRACDWRRGKTILRIERFTQALFDKIDPFRTSKSKLMQQYTEPKPDGSMVIRPNDPKYPEFLAEYRLMADEAFDVDLLCLVEDRDIETCEAMSVTADDIALLRGLGLVGSTLDEGDRKILENEARAAEAKKTKEAAAEQAEEEKSDLESVDIVAEETTSKIQEKREGK